MKRIRDYEKDERSYLRYCEQQQAINEIAAKLGLVAYRPDYHGLSGDRNTVLIYLPADAAHNSAVDKEPFHYTNGEAQDFMRTQKMEIPQKYIYRDCLWSFANSDVKGLHDYDFANFGRVDLRGLRWKESLEGHMLLALLTKMQNQYAAASGGWLAIQEADETYNDYNRRLIDAMKMAYGRAFLGNINLDHDERQAVVDGKRNAYTEYTGQKVYNCEYSFCVPIADEELGQMIRNWNDNGYAPECKNANEIIDRVSKIGGLNLLWF